MTKKDIKDAESKCPVIKQSKRILNEDTVQADGHFICPCGYENELPIWPGDEECEACGEGQRFEADYHGDNITWHYLGPERG